MDEKIVISETLNREVDQMLRIVNDRPPTAPLPPASPIVRFKVGEIFNPGGFTFRIMSIGRNGILIRPIDADLVLSGRQRNKERRRHHK
jgi:hypothetical protein